MYPLLFSCQKLDSNFMAGGKIYKNLLLFIFFFNLKRFLFSTAKDFYPCGVGDTSV